MIVTVVLVLFSVRCTCGFIGEGVTCDCYSGPCFVFCEMYRLTCLCSLDIWHAVLQPSPTRWHMTNHMYAYY